MLFSHRFTHELVSSSSCQLLRVIGRHKPIERLEYPQSSFLVEVRNVEGSRSYGNHFPITSNRTLLGSFPGIAIPLPGGISRTETERRVATRSIRRGRETYEYSTTDIGTDLSPQFRQGLSERARVVFSGAVPLDRYGSGGLLGGHFRGTSKRE